MLFYISCASLIIWIILFWFIVLLRINVKGKAITIYWMVFVVSYAVFCFWAEPSVSDDLYRHYMLIDGLRQGNDLKGHFVDTMVLFKFILFIVSKTQNNGWLPFTTILVWGWLIYKTIKKYISKNVFTTRAVMLYFMALIAAFCSFNLVSGIRNSLCVAIFIYSLYYNYLEGRKLRHYLILAFFSFIHLVMSFFFVLQLVYELINIMRKKGLRIMWIVLIVAAGIFSTGFIGRLFAGEPGLLGTLSEKWALYHEWKRELTFELFVQWSGMIYVLVSIFLIGKKLDEDEYIIRFSFFLILLSITTNVMPIIANRMLMPVAALSLPAFNNAYLNTRGKIRAIWMGTGFVILTLEAVYMMYAMFGFISFNGINIQKVIQSILK